MSAQICFQNQMKNLATAVQVSIDTAMQHCEVKFSGRELGYRRRHSHSCSGFVLVTWGAEIVMVERTWLGSVNIWKEKWRMGGGWRGHAESLVGWRPYVFTIPLLGELGNASVVSVGFMVIVVLTNQLYQWEMMSK